jgi:hypothetical protein
LLCHLPLKGVVGTERYLIFRERTILFSFFFWSIVHRILSQIRNNRCSFWWQIFAAQWQKKNKTEILSEMPGFLTKIFPKKLGEFWFLKNYYHFLTAPKSMSPPCYSLEKTLDGLPKNCCITFSFRKLEKQTLKTSLSCKQYFT